ncbi:MAG: nucleotidyl transferase AbiEii/AbiGii toxin family protein [Deltaproteobacteria bacterium]|nr:nucleotidyl transferase AbiEii/AbiGii toxin family protein [Deltaproteobacteria bacterium]
MDPSFYENRLYPLQDRVLATMAPVEGAFYLTGGTAMSRGYFGHRYSDDLDFFMNDDDSFGLQADRVVHALSQCPDWTVRVVLKDVRFVRLNVRQGEVDLKVEFINDVPSHIGPIADHPVLRRLDSRENILANKVTAALDREEPKDLADIWALCVLGGLSLQRAVHDADSKAAGVFAPDLARVLASATADDYGLIRWKSGPGVEVFCRDLARLAEELLLAPLG